MLSSSSARDAGSGARIIGRTASVARIGDREDQEHRLPGHEAQHPLGDGRRRSTWPADPAAVAMASAIERFSSDAARPTTARMTPKPVPAMPKPTRIARAGAPAGVTAKDDSTSPTA